MKLPLEVAFAVLFSPLATVLAWRDIVRRRDLSGPLRGWWAIVSVAPVIGPLLYLGIGRGWLW